MIALAEALAAYAQHLAPLAPERVPLARAAGRVLREDVAAQCDLPRYSQSALDGSVLGASARAEARLRLPAFCVELIRERKVEKGDALEIARMAGILAAKKT